MSSIDERIVQMRFSNDQFEKGIATTTKSLGTLKEKLNFDSVKGSLTGLGDNIKNVSFDSLATSIDTIGSKFSALSAAAVVALGNIAAQAVQTGLTMAKSLTVQPIIQGYQDYNRKLTSVQTIAAATGKSIKDIEPYFDALDTYADKTIYNLSDMTGALAKFTNAGVSLDKAIPAIKGISNMTALAGQDAGAAGIAYYNLSQSIAGGFLTTMDYKSLNLANIATKGWKDEMIKAAIAGGTLKNIGGGLYSSTAKGAKDAYSAAELFSRGLSDQWATTDILLKVLGDYGDTTTEIGAKAQASAQDVKSLSMMMDTLKAAVGTGWTDTFQIVLGDLDQSKKLWTGLTQSIQGYLDTATEARNNLLKGWAELGGRSVIIDALGKLFTNLINIFKAVGDAFLDIFPPTSSKQLYDLTLGFSKFVDAITPSEQTLNNLKRTLRGVFAIFGIVWEIVKAVGKAFFDLVGFTAQGSSGLLSITAVIGDFIYAMYDAIKSGGALNTFFTGLAAIIKIPIAIIKSFFLTLGALIDTVSGPSTDAIGGIADRLKASFDPLGNIGLKLNTIWTDVMKTFEKVGSFIKPVLKAVTDGFNNLGKAFVNSFTNANYNSILSTIDSGLFGALVIMFKTFFDKGVVGVFDGGFVKSFTNIFNQLTDALQAFTNSIKAKTLLTIAIALGILTASIIALTLVDPAKLTPALTAMTVMMTQLFLALGAFTKIASAKGIAKMPVIAASLVILATAIGILTTSVIRLSKLSWEELLKGLLGVTGLLFGIVAVSQTMGSKLKGMFGASIAMISLAIAIKILASAMSDLSKLSWEDTVKGLVSVGVILTEIAIFNKFASASKGAIANGVSLILLATAIKILASAVTDFANLETAKLIQGISALAGVLMLLTVFGKVTANGSSMIGLGIGLILVASSIKIFASAISDFGGISWDNLIRGLVGMSATLIIIAGAMRLMPSNMILTAIGLVIVAEALTIMAKALDTIGGMTWDEIGRGLTVLAGSLAILVAALYLMSGALPGAAALIVAAGALAILAPVLTTLGGMSWDEIGRGLVMLAASLAIITAAGYLLTGALPGLIGLGVAALMVGAGTLMAGAGVMLLSAALVALGASAVIGTATLVAMATALINLIPLLMMKVGEGIINILKVISNSTVAFIDAFKAILTAILVTIIEMTPLLIKTVITLVGSILKAIDDNLPKFLALGLNIIINLLDGIAKKLPDVIAKAADIIVALLNGLAKQLPKIIDSGIKLVIAFIDGIAKGIKNNTAKFVEAGSKLFRAIIDGIAAAVKQGGADIAYAGQTLGDALITAAKNALGIKSPSKEFYKIGEYVVQGLVNGVEDGTKTVGESTKKMGETAIDGLNKSLRSISDITLSNMDMEPTIRPVLDLSDIKKKTSSINSMLATSDLSLDSAYAKATSISIEQRAAKESSQVTQEPTVQTGDTTISFVQNNNSPKALSATEIYRQTRNQISAAKGVFSLA